METAYGELVLNWLLRGDPLTPPSTWYVGLDVSLSGDAYSEPVYGSYARAALPRAAGSWASASGQGQIVSAVDVAWPAVDTAYMLGEQVRRFFLATQPTPSGEVLLVMVDLAQPVTIVGGGVPTLSSGTVVIDAGD